MKEYIVITDGSAGAKERLQAVCEKVGSGAMADILIVLTDATEAVLRSVEGVKHVEQSSLATPHLAQVDQQSPHGWALPWISNSGGNYQNQRDGAGVDVYIVDTGIRDTHDDLAGRVETLWSFDDQPYSVTGYAPSHGTSVAGCAAGTTYGTAKKATIINLRIDFTTVSIIKACDMILKHHLNKPDNRQSVVNFSGGSISPTIGDVFARLTKWGIVVVASAGNDGGPEPMYPAKNMWVVAVGATNLWDQPAWFTNRKCEIFGPGQDVTTASVFSDHSSTVTSGTSFSAPYYAGLFAALLTGSDKFNTANQVSSFMFQIQQQVCDLLRVPQFDNGGYQIRTMNSKGLSGTYYRNPSRDFTDAEIRQYCIDHLDQPQAIADAARQYNISLARLAKSLEPDGHRPDVISQYFIDAGVTPWWFVNGVPV